MVAKKPDALRPGPGKRGPGVGVGPGVAAVGGAVDFVGPVGEAATAFRPCRRCTRRP